MFGWIKNLFSSKDTNVQANTSEEPETLDMRETPVDNPLDYREDGSIQPGDPAYDAMMESINNGKPMIANQREDGRWDVNFT